MADSGSCRPMSEKEWKYCEAPSPPRFWTARKEGFCAVEEGGAGEKTGIKMDADMTAQGNAPP